MTSGKKMKTGKTDTTRGAVHQERTTEKKNAAKEKNAGKDVLPVTKRAPAVSLKRENPANGESRKGPDAEKARAHSLHDTAKKNAQVEKNRAKVARLELQNHPATESPEGSGAAKKTGHRWGERHRAAHQ